MGLIHRLRQTRLEHLFQGVSRTLRSRVWLVDQTDGECMVGLMRYLLKEDSNCIDVGAHNGHYTGYMQRLAPRGRHFAFEPIPHYARLLGDTFRGHPGVEVHAIAASDRDDTIRFNYVRSNPGYSGMRRRIDLKAGEQVEVVEVATRRLDDVIPADVPIRFIKIDVEGAEYQVLSGARRIITTDRPYIVFEFGRGAADTYATTPAMMHALLTGDYGLSLFRMNGQGPLDLPELERLFHTGECWNFIARAYRA